MNKKLNTVIAVLLALAVVFVAINTIRAEYSPYVKQFARTGTYINSIETEALIIRNETVVNPGIYGVYESYRNEGDRVSTGSSLGAVISGEIDSATMEELNRLNEEIENVTKSISDAGVLSIPDDQVASTLALSISNFRYAVSKNDAQEAIKLAEDMKILTERKFGVTTPSSAQEQLAALQARREEITSTLGGVHQGIYAPTYGQYSDKVDGLEKVLCYENALKATPSLAESYFKMARTGVNTMSICKIVNNYEWYILFTLTKDECEGLKKGKSYNVSFKELGEKEIQGVIENISEFDSKGVCAVTMRFDRHIDNLTYLRITNVEICKEKYSGIYIPGNALRVHEGILGVWVQNEISLDFRSIEAAYRTDDFILAKENAQGKGDFKNILLYDNIVINPDE